MWNLTPIESITNRVALYIYLLPSTFKKKKRRIKADSFPSTIRQTKKIIIEK